jgi:hypothetical protein
MPYEWQQIAVYYKGHAVQGTNLLRSIAGIVGSNPTVCIYVFSVSVFCIGRDVAMSPPSSV